MRARRFRRRAPVYSVTELTSQLKRLLQREYPSIRVSGEISNARRYPSGHWYFTLKDDKARISCVCFRRDAAYLRAEPADGLAVVAHGRLGVYEARGQYQLVVDAMEGEGQGALQRRFERLKAKLEREGLFDEERKRALPRMPRRIGIVTSPRGAVIADMLRILERRFPGLRIRIYPVRVQGRGAAREIAQGLRNFSETQWAETVIVGRGGGSLEDLWAFNEEIVARAISESSVPVVSAVGHQTDFTIADFVADLRAATPSAAAELVVPELGLELKGLHDAAGRAASAMRLRLARHRQRLADASMDRAARAVERRIDDAEQAMDNALQGLVGHWAIRARGARDRLERLEARLSALDLRVRLARQAQRLASATQRLAPAMSKTLARGTSRLQELHRALHALSPVAILARGYAIVLTREGSPLVESGQVSVGDPLGVKLHRGRLEARVERVEPGATPAPPGVA